MEKAIKFFAHRGVSSKAPENTMPAFELAVAHHVHGIELDVHLSKEGELVVIHDESTLRTTGKDYAIGKLFMDEIKALDAGSWFAPEFAGTRIPTLEEVLILLENTDLTLNIELKNSYVDYPQLEQKTLEALKKHHMVERAVISSFNHLSLKRMHLLCPQLECAPLYDACLYNTAEYTLSFGARAIHPHWRTLDTDELSPVFAEGITIRPWTVNTAAAAQAMIDKGITEIITNYPYDVFEQK
ncbi:MAG: glycerophosphodiester phosphodiesterase [Eubacteriales bacterium]|nr:glycerophosphodiester phosphodiesterase [Eubacteriales bacterium]